MLKVSSKQYGKFFIAEVQKGYYQIAFVTHKIAAGDQLCELVSKVFDDYWDASNALVESVEHYNRTGELLHERRQYRL